MKIYGIRTGENYRVVGYCTSEEAAIKACAAKNGDMQCSTWYRDCIYSYFEMECMDNDATVVPEVWYLSDVSLFAGPKFGGTMDGKIWYTDAVTAYHPPMVSCNPPYDFINVYLWTKTNDENAIIKAAKEAFADHAERILSAAMKKL